ncbi:9471_t:CDS:2, partial [Funneliformis caledonium]
VNIRYMHNHMINSAKSLSFRHVNEEVREELLNLFKDEYRKVMLGSRNGESMFERLAEVVKNYNDSDQGKAILQAYDTRIGKAFILSSFELLNTSITLLYTSCTVGALPLGLFITSDELEVTLERAINMLKIILSSYAFYGCGPQTGPILFLTDDSSAERNALELCYPKGFCLL